MTQFVVLCPKSVGFKLMAFELNEEEIGLIGQNLLSAVVAEYSTELKAD
jgi:hypothetical protein